MSAEILKNRRGNPPVALYKDRQSPLRQLKGANPKESGNRKPGAMHSAASITGNLSTGQANAGSRAARVMNSVVVDSAIYSATANRVIDSVTVDKVVGSVTVGRVVNSGGKRQ